MTRKQRRLVMIGAGALVLALAVGLVLTALRDSIVFFNSPTDVIEKKVQAGTRIRLGGLVQPGTVVRNDVDAAFDITDGKNVVRVTYRGVLPDLFREGQGVVTEGTLVDAKSFRADTVLAKHDENYMPKEVADSLKKQGHWKDDYAKPGAKPGDMSGKAAQ
jgi:cytochrome c-type biogenesis protein CcmE